MVYLQITENTEQASLMLNYLKTLDFIKVIDKPDDLTYEDEDFDVDEFIRALDEKPEEEHTVLEQIAAGLRDVKSGNTMGFDQMMKEIEEELEHE